MMRLPVATHAAGLDAAFIGVPLGHRRLQPRRRALRPAPDPRRISLIRPTTCAPAPRPSTRCRSPTWATCRDQHLLAGEVGRHVTDFYREVLGHGCVPLSWAATTPSRCPSCARWPSATGRIALIHVDAHADVNDEMFGERIAHGTPFRRAVEEGLLQTNKVWQIGLRGSGYAADDFDWPRRRGFTVIPAHEVWWQSLAPIMDKVRAVIGDAPCYLSFDIDGIDPAYAGGTGARDRRIERAAGAGDRRGLRRRQDLVELDLVEESRPRTTRAATPRCWAPTCCTRCCACCRGCGR